MSNDSTGLKSLAQGRSDIFKVSVHDIHVKDGWNSREANDALNVAHIDQLARSIAMIGVKEPLTVYWENGKAWISDGHCRHAATLRAIDVYKAEIKTIPVKTEDRYSSEAERVLSQLVRNSGKPLSAIEQSRVYKRLIDLGWQAKDIAEKVGVSPARISQVLELQTLPEQIKALVLAGSVSAGLALETVRQDGSEATEKLTDGVAKANGEGRKRALPRDLGTEKKIDYKKAVIDAMEHAYIDNSSEENVTITMNYEAFDVFKKILGL